VISSNAAGVVLDVEGTTSSVRFVYDVLFPYARRELAGFLAAHWDEAEVAQARDLIARDAGAASFAVWTEGAAGAAARSRVIAEVERLMDADAKATGLKELQGLIWRSGFESGLLRAHVYPDVPPALAAWTAAGKDVRIYSSGSVAAQRLFFGHTEQGDLTRFFRGHYDTTTGPKREAASYAKIVGDMGLPADRVLFLSDVTAELDAARTAGLQTGLVVRPGNAPAPPEHGHAVINDFGQV
jgi:enolase-phosphatase E1